MAPLANAGLRTFRRGFTAGLLLLAVLAIPATVAASRVSIAGILVSRLEQRFPRPDAGELERYRGMIVLGGNSERFREAGRLARLYPHLEIFASGAGDKAAVMDMLGPGIDPARVTLENRSRNTHQNALYTAASLRAYDAGRWLLVTSATHMPRSVGAFRRVHLSVEPWPVYDLGPADPQPASVAIHEWLGLVAYRVLGRSAAFFPDRSTL